MHRTFSVTRSCNPQRHFLVDLSGKVARVRKLIEQGDYFAINRPRQYGKTTMLFELLRRLSAGYLVLPPSFEGIGGDPFESEEIFPSAAWRSWPNDSNTAPQGSWTKSPETLQRLIA